MNEFKAIESTTDKKLIRGVLADSHQNVHYKQTELSLAVKNIVESIQENNPELNGNMIAHFIAQYMHYSSKKDKFYFNSKRKGKNHMVCYEMIKFENQDEDEYSTNSSSQKKSTQKKRKKTGRKTKKKRIKAVIQVEKDYMFNEDESESDLQVTEESKESIPDKPKKQFEDIDDDLIEQELDNMEKNFIQSKKDYRYPKELKYNVTKRNDLMNGPYGSQWVHDTQYDDPYDKALEERAKIYDELRKIVLPEQRSKAWFAMRRDKITASDGGCVLGKNKHEPQYNFILKKVFERPFTSNQFCYHGKKLEEIATMIYAYRMNVTVEEFGLMGHPKYTFLGASPDGICNRYKLDGKHASRFVGRMLEIKCPFRRRIKLKGPQVDYNYKKYDTGICPVYYWIQVQLQLECCDLEECDFWQCELEEYNTKEEFIKDTTESEPFRSKETGYEKGCLIQLMPHSSSTKFMDPVKDEDGKIIKYVRNEEKYTQTIYEDTAFIYPPRIEMSPYECDQWITETLSTIHKDPKYSAYSLDRIIYWKLRFSGNITIKRDREWFSKNFDTFKQMWNYVEFFRANSIQANILKRYIESREIKRTKDIMMVIDKLTHTKDQGYDLFISELLQDVENSEESIKVKAEENKKQIEKENKMKKEEEQVTNAMLAEISANGVSLFVDDDSSDDD